MHLYCNRFPLSCYPRPGAPNLAGRLIHSGGGLYRNSFAFDPVDVVEFGRSDNDVRDAMSVRGSGITELVPFAPKSDNRAGPNDPLDKAGHLILDLVRQAANDVQASYQESIETSRKLAAQLRGAEDRIRELEAKLRDQEDRADRAEKWLYQIHQEIEQKLLDRNDRRLLESSLPQAVFRNQRQ